MKEFKDSKGRPWQLAVNCDTIEGAMAQVIGSAKSMGLQVVE